MAMPDWKDAEISKLALQERLKGAIRAKSESVAQDITPARYDDVFFRGLHALDEDTEY